MMQNREEFVEILDRVLYTYYVKASGKAEGRPDKNVLFYVKDKGHYASYKSDPKNETEDFKWWVMMLLVEGGYLELDVSGSGTKITILGIQKLLDGGFSQAYYQSQFADKLNQATFRNLKIQKIVVWASLILSLVAVGGTLLQWRTQERNNDLTEQAIEIERSQLIDAAILHSLSEKWDSLTKSHPSKDTSKH